LADTRIFLSHAADDRSFVNAVAGALREQGLEAWLDDETAAPGQRFADAVQDALRSSSVVVAFLGEGSNSPWMNFEIGAALGEAKTVLPVFLSGPARDTSPPQLRHLVGIDASDLKPDEVAEGITELLAAAA
jgi:hypothetical protein